MGTFVRFFDGRQYVSLGLLAVQGSTRGLPVEMLDIIGSIIGLVVAPRAVVPGCVGVFHRYMMNCNAFKCFPSCGTRYINVFLYQLSRKKGKKRQVRINTDFSVKIPR